MHRLKPTSAENGRRSCGPTTPEGREKARLAVLKHGLCAKAVVRLSSEAEEDWDDHYKSYMDTYQPADDVQVHFVADIAAASWRLGRALDMENALLTLTSQDGEPQTESGADCFLSVLDNARFNTLQIYIARIERSCQRALNNLIKTRKYFGQDPAKTVEPPEVEYTPDPVPPAEETKPQILQTETQPKNEAKPQPQTPKTPRRKEKIKEEVPVTGPVQSDDWPKVA